MNTLIMIAGLCVGLLGACWMMLHWRKAFLFLFPLIYIEDVVRKAIIPGQHIWPQFIRDGIVLCLYAVMIGQILKGFDADRFKVHPLFVAYLVLIGVLGVGALNPLISSAGPNYWALPLLGARYWVFYVPMAYVAYKWLVDVHQLFSLGNLLSFLITIATVLAVYEISFFYLDEELPTWLGPVGEQLRIGENNRGLDKAFGRSTTLIFAYSLFATTSKYSVQALFAFAILGGIICVSRGKHKKFGGVMALVSIILSRGRSVMIGFFLYLGLSVLWGALKNKRLVSIVFFRKYVRYCVFGTVFVGVLGFFYVQDVAAVLFHFVNEFADVEAIKFRYRLHFGGVIENIMNFQDVLGLGTGMGVHGSEWVTGQAPKGLTEGGFGTPYIDFGLWGWVAYMGFMSVCLHSCIKSCWKLRNFETFPFALLLTGFHCGVWGYWLKSRQLFGDSSVQLVLWISLGFVLALKNISVQSSSKPEGVFTEKI